MEQDETRWLDCELGLTINIREACDFWMTPTRFDGWAKTMDRAELFFQWLREFILRRADRTEGNTSVAQNGTYLMWHSDATLFHVADWVPEACSLQPLPPAPERYTPAANEVTVTFFTKFDRYEKCFYCALKRRAEIQRDVTKRGQDGQVLTSVFMHLKESEFYVKEFLAIDEWYDGPSIALDGTKRGPLPWAWHMAFDASPPPPTTTKATTTPELSRSLGLLKCEVHPSLQHRRRPDTKQDTGSSEEAQEEDISYEDYDEDTDEEGLDEDESEAEEKPLYYKGEFFGPRDFRSIGATWSQRRLKDLPACRAVAGVRLDAGEMIQGRRSRGPETGRSDLQEGLHYGAQLAVIHRGVSMELCVGEAAPGRPMRKDDAQGPIHGPRAEERGALSFDDAVERFLPGFGTKGKSQVTLRHCLTHTAGLWASTLKMPEKKSPEEVLQHICQQPLAEGWEPGRRCGYDSPAWYVLAGVAEAAAGDAEASRFAELVKKEIFEPLGLRSSSIGMRSERRAELEKAGRLASWRDEGENDEVFSGAEVLTKRLH
eukprot:g33644.t1